MSLVLASQRCGQNQSRSGAHRPDELVLIIPMDAIAASDDDYRAAEAARPMAMHAAKVRLPFDTEALASPQIFLSTYFLSQLLPFVV
ncbi:hypothetical protein FGB62_107g114 [Gracilaria domingensis]|nr:hypothetical protein FGB62_107g114 [Gracilaria domingensis]